MSGERIAELAEQLLTPERRARFRHVAAHRMNCLTVVFENIADPFNVAASLRSAESFGVPQAHIVTQDTAPLNDTTSASAGRWIEATRHTELAPLVAELRAGGYTLLGTVPPGKAVPFQTVAPPEKLAIFMGGETDGLSAEAQAACDQLITIPMVGFTESLNLSTATAILLQHFAAAYRERGAGVLLSAAEQEALYLAWCERDLRAKTRGQLALEDGAESSG